MPNCEENNYPNITLFDDQPQCIVIQNLPVVNATCRWNLRTSSDTGIYLRDWFIDFNTHNVNVHCTGEPTISLINPSGSRTLANLCQDGKGSKVINSNELLVEFNSHDAHYPYFRLCFIRTGCFPITRVVAPVFSTDDGSVIRLCENHTQIKYVCDVSGEGRWNPDPLLPQNRCQEDLHGARTVSVTGWHTSQIIAPIVVLILLLILILGFVYWIKKQKKRDDKTNLLDWYLQVLRYQITRSCGKRDQNSPEDPDTDKMVYKAESTDPEPKDRAPDICTVYADVEEITPYGPVSVMPRESSPTENHVNQEDRSENENLIHKQPVYAAVNKPKKTSSETKTAPIYGNVENGSAEQK